MSFFCTQTFTLLEISTRNRHRISFNVHKTKERWQSSIGSCQFSNRKSQSSSSLPERMIMYKNQAIDHFVFSINLDMVDNRLMSRLWLDSDVKIFNLTYMLLLLLFISSRMSVDNVKRQRRVYVTMYTNWWCVCFVLNIEYKFIHKAIINSGQSLKGETQRSELEGEI